MMIASRKQTVCSLFLFLTAPLGFAQSVATQEHIDKVTGCLPPPVVVKGDPVTCKTLAVRMSELKVNGVSIAVVHNGTIEWAKGFGVERQGGKPVSAETLFQAGSISKPLAAMAALHQVQIGKLALDANINTFLTSWKLPPSDAAPGATITLRELLTHTAGMTVHGFPGYASGEPVPTLVQVLNGEKPANTPAIRIESAPGKKWNYSGGGYTVMQQAVIDVTKQPFPKLLHDTVLAPIGMTHSTYEQPLPNAMRASAATPYAISGAEIPGGAHSYPEMAAAGLWTTPTDLCRYILENQQSLGGKANHVLSREMTEQMMTPGLGSWGLGLQIGGSKADQYFSHGGVNEGFESLFVGYEHNGEGAVVMTNAQGGSRLANEVMRSIAAVYGWPDFAPSTRTAMKLDPKVLARYVGTYEVNPAFSLVFTMEGDQLMTQATGQNKFPIFPESETKVFLKIVDAEVEFFFDEKGHVSYLMLYQNGQKTKATRKPS